MTNFDQVNNVAVIIRSVGERTESLCRRIAESQVPSEHVVVIHERPFAKAVRRAFEIGIDYGLDWTLCLDADVLMTDQAIQLLVESAESSAANNVFSAQGKLMDRLLGTVRTAIPTLYVTKHLQTVLSNDGIDQNAIRPEYSVKVNMKARGFQVQTHCITLGLHDYCQYYRDIFRKCFVYAHKHRAMSHLPDMWRFLSRYDGDFRVALEGWKAGMRFEGMVKIDVADFPNEIGALLHRMRLTERPALLDLDTCVDVKKVILEPPLSLLAWQKYRRSSYYRINRKWRELGPRMFFRWVLGRVLTRPGTPST